MNAGIRSRLRGLPRRAASVLWRYASGRLSAHDVARIAMRVTRFERWGVRPISQRRLLAIANAAAEANLESAGLRARIEVLTRTVPDVLELRRQMHDAYLAIDHLRRVEQEYARLTADREPVAVDQDTARQGVQALVNRLQRILFEHGDTTPQSRSAATLVLGGRPMDDAFATLINLSEASHGARPFQYVLPFLAPTTPFPLPWPEREPPLRVVDVGSQELSYEGDMYAPLRRVAPLDATGFDPFAPPSDAPDGVAEVRRPDGATIRTWPCLVADGGMATFHVNRYDATSSTLPANHALTRPFGLLDQAVETIETRTLRSRRLDDVLNDAMPVDLLKIDVQGASHTVLDHARDLLKRTLVCHVEAEFAPIYLGERLFADIDTLLREAGFAFVDFFSLGRQRYASFDTAAARAFHRGRTLWADCIYLRGLDTPDGLTPAELFRAALIVHACYNKQDLAAELLGRADAATGGTLRAAYVSGLTPEAAA